MAGRKKKPAPAELRTVGLFNGGLTPLEEATQIAKEQDGLQSRPPTDRSSSGTQDALVSSAIRWLGLEVFGAAGDDVFLATKEGKGAVLCVVHARPGGSPSRTTEVRLSDRHLEKLRQIFR